MGMMTIYDYNKVNYQRLESFAEFRNLFLNDDNSVKTNVFLGVSDATCLENLEASPAFVGIQRHGGGNVSLGICYC